MIFAERKREVLPRVDIWINDKRGSTTDEKRYKPLANTMCSLLNDPTMYNINPAHELLPSEFDWKGFICFTLQHKNFDQTKTTYYVTLSRDKQVIASGNVGLEGEFRQAIKKMLALVGRSTNVIQEAARYGITWELRDGDPMYDELPSFEEGELFCSRSLDLNQLGDDQSRQSQSVTSSAAEGSRGPRLTNPGLERRRPARTRALCSEGLAQTTTPAWLHPRLSRPL
ncbi:uncharacterized protein LY79DRAFT_532687 [Colletotrichum navitas]|uniref:Uncharacterized protein n=1 Tax=Colletotrichum navitas TaxID=681940 RepID=A0AAD8VD24_9PEZI|nr:uncharacterized protein LY79DRAFT_532687 [Colletotrichum navitas]KAK1600140.1 hypothetical protein LY79DRAFT_532687 [Colletotrichum navitas]